MTGPQPTTGDLYEALSRRLHLEWLEGDRDRPIRYAPDESPETSSLIGHLNFIHTHRIQVIGHSEYAYLDQLSDSARRETLDRLFTDSTDVILLANGLPADEALRGRARETGISLWRSDLSSHNLISHIEYHYTQHYSPSITLHGVFLEVIGMGVLITGEAAMGKSELALELISRGHRLIADDTPEFARVAPDILSGRCPPMLQDLLEVRGLGILDIRAMFGDTAIKFSKYLRLIVHLRRMSEHELAGLDRLKGSQRMRNILGVEIPEITLPVAPGRNLAVLVETAARNHILLQRGHDAAAKLIERQQRRLAHDWHAP